MKNFKKFNLMKDEPTTASGGTKQDAAHSFEKKETCPTCDREWGDEEGSLCSNSWHLVPPYIMNQLKECKSETQQFKSELTRLRSELQQTKQEKENMHIVHCRMLETRDKRITELTSELQQERELRKGLEKDKEYLLDMVAKVMSLDSLTPSARASVWQQANECLSDNAVLRYK